MRRLLLVMQISIVVVSIVLACARTSPGHRVLTAATHAAVVVSGVSRPLARPPAPLPGTARTVVRWSADGLQRELVEVAPAAADGPLPLVVVLHGRRQTPWRAERSEGWDTLAAGGRAVVAYGAGFAGSWNAGRCCGRAAAHHVNDDAYLLRVLRVEQRRHRIDPRRVYLVGFSNGGMLAYRFACAHSTSISAFAVVAGALEAPSCHPSRALAVLAVHGLDDRVIPYDGSRFSPVAGAPTASVAASLLGWQAAAPGPGVVQLVRLPHLGHEWPTRRRGWDATGWIWRFLEAHPAATAR